MKRTVSFYDWFCGAEKILGRLGITIGETYELETHEVSSMVMNLYDAGLAVMIKPINSGNWRKSGGPHNPGGMLICVSNHKGSRPFGQIG